MSGEEKKTNKKRGSYNKRPYEALNESGYSLNDETLNYCDTDETPETKTTTTLPIDDLYERAMLIKHMSEDTGDEYEDLQFNFSCNSDTIGDETDVPLLSYDITENDLEYETLNESDIEFDDSHTEYNEEANAKNLMDPESQLLFPGSSVTVGAFMLLIATFSMKHNLIGEAIQQLLNIIAVVLPHNHVMCTTLHSFKKMFRSLKNPFIKHFYCAHCLGYLTDHSVQKCPYGLCQKDLTERKEYFLEIPVESQLKNLYSQSGFYTKLQERFQRKEGPFYRDIYDGSLYRSYFEKSGVLSFPENISFTFNTDGAAVFKSSKVAAWPIFLVVNELPYKIRMNKENMILAGLWFGKQKPAMSTFLLPYLKTFRNLEKGIKVYSPERGNFTCKGFLLCATADLPARSMLCNGMQYNGEYSCWKCKQPGQSVARGAGFCHVFPFDTASPKGEFRTHQGVLEDGCKALDNLEAKVKKFAVNGVKGPSWLAFFPRFNIVDGIAIDYMHGVLLGVQKRLIQLWFSVEFKGKPFNYHNKVCEVDRRLEEILRLI